MPETSGRPSCLICGSSKIRFDFVKNDFKIFFCPDCGFKFVYPPPEDTSAIYRQDYFYGAGRGFGYVNYDEDKVAMRPFFESVLAAVRRYQPGGGRLLDVGAATGFFVKLAVKRGWKAMGLEISPYAVSAAAKNGVPVIQGTLETVDFQPASFDVISLLDVIEHVSDPALMLEKCAKLLRPGGILAVNTPDTSSLWAKIFGPRWHAYCPPEHMSYFNSANLSRLLGHRGFSIMRVTKLSKGFTPAYVFSMLFRWQRLKFWKWLADGIEGTAINRLPLPVNIRDNFFVIARLNS